MRGWRAWARPHGDSAVRRLCESLSVLSTGAADTVRRRGECVDGALGRARTAIPPCVACVNLCSLPRGGYRQTERGVRGWRAWVRPRGDSAVRRLSVNPTLPSTARQFLPCSTDAHCKVTTHYFLPSSPYSLLPAKNQIWIIFYQIFVLAVIAIVHHTGKEVREWARN